MKIQLNYFFLGIFSPIFDITKLNF
jgi:hypothetical protein